MALGLGPRVAGPQRATPAETEPPPEWASGEAGPRFREAAVPSGLGWGRGGEPPDAGPRTRWPRAVWAPQASRIRLATGELPSQASEFGKPPRAAAGSPVPPPPSSLCTSFYYLSLLHLRSPILGPSGQRPGESETSGARGRSAVPCGAQEGVKGPARGGRWRPALGASRAGAGAPGRGHCGPPPPQRPAPPEPETRRGSIGSRRCLCQNRGLGSVGGCSPTTC